MALLEASGIGKNFGETKVLKDISLTLEQGEALAIIGSSGSGKTTLLRCLNFLERPDTGVISVNGETMWDAADPATQRESEVRKAPPLRSRVPELQPLPPVHRAGKRDAGGGASGEGAARLQGQQKGHPRPAGSTGP